MGRVNPSASIKSALPLRLEKARLPCLTTGRPQAAASNAAPVDKFRLPEASPPVPTMSMASRPAGSAGLRASARMAPAKPRTSAAVTPLVRSAASSAPAIAGREIGRRQEREQRRGLRLGKVAALHEHVEGVARAGHRLEEIAHQDRTVGSQHAFRVELHALDRQRSMPHAHDFAFRGSRRDFEHRGNALRRRDQRVIAARFERRGMPAYRPLPSCMTGDTLPCISRAARTTLPPNTSTND